MEKDHYIGLLILLGIIAIAAFGGNKNAMQNQSGSNTSGQSISEQITADQTQVNQLKTQLQIQQQAENHSPYYGMVSIQYVNRSNSPNYEYVVLHMQDNATSGVQVSGWRLQSISSGQGVTIPNGTDLYWSGQVNGTAPIILIPGDNLYLISGLSPIGYNFRINKCSGYLSQFQTFIPYISTNCPSPREESSTSIPNINSNNACLDYIEGLPSCRTVTDNLPVGWSYQCVNFITTKLNYNACIDNHKNDSDFYQKEWRVYLGQSNTLWQSEREHIVLYDNNGKIVSELTY